MNTALLITMLQAAPAGEALDPAQTEGGNSILEGLSSAVSLLFTKPWDWTVALYTKLSELPVVSLLLLIPLLASIVIAFTPRQSLKALRRIGIGAMILEALVSFTLLLNNDPSGNFVFNETYSWIPALGIRYVVGVDGISLWLILLTTVLTPIAMYASFGSIDTKVKEFVASFLLLEVGMIGAFVALDLFLFYVFWELMLVPMFLIIGIWGGKQKIYASMKFFIYTMIGSMVMLIALVYAGVQYHALWEGLAEDARGGLPAYSFAYEHLIRVHFSHADQIWMFAAFVIAFAIKVPMFPFHTWLPDAHVQAPTGGSVILAAVLLKLGGYGILRFAIPFFPYACHVLGPTMAVLAVVGIIYGAMCAWVQTDVKKLVAYSSVSHLGFVVLGLFALNRGGVGGAILQMVSHGVSTGALFLLVGVIYDRRHTRELSQFGGLAKVMPVYAVLFVIVTMSSVGLPGTNGFVGEFMILSGTFFSDQLNVWPKTFALAAATGVIFAAIYMLHATLKMFWGPVSNSENANLPDVNRRELWAILPLVALIFVIGFFPRPFLSRMNPSIDRVLAAYTSGWNRPDGAALDAPTAAPSDEQPEQAPTAAALDVAGADGRLSMLVTGGH